MSFIGNYLANLTEKDISILLAEINLLSNPMNIALGNLISELHKHGVVACQSVEISGKPLNESSFPVILRVDAYTPMEFLRHLPIPHKPLFVKLKTAEGRNVTKDNADGPLSICYDNDDACGIDNYSDGYSIDVRFYETYFMVHEVCFRNKDKKNKKIVNNKKFYHSDAHKLANFMFSKISMNVHA